MIKKVLESHEAIGKKFNNWTIIKVYTTTERKGTHVIARCDCGIEQVTQLGDIKGGQSKCCRTCGYSKFKIYSKDVLKTFIGKKFDMLTLTLIVKDIYKGCQSRFAFICDCGGIGEGRFSDILRGAKKDCGCRQRENHKKGIGWKHGFVEKLEYNSWQNMIQRCTNSNNKDFVTYGACGITVCEEWRDFRNFIKDMGERPEPKREYSIDRIDNNLGYFKANCRWSTRAEQVVNRGPYKNSKTN